LPVPARRRGRPADHSSEDTRAEILATAHRLFGEAGYAGASVEQVATESGLTERAVYHYFPSKRALFEAASETALERLVEEIRTRVFVHEGLRDRLAGYIDVFRVLHETQPSLVPFIGMMLVDSASQDQAERRARAQRSTDESSAGAAIQVFLAALVDDAIRNGELRADVDRDAAITLLSMVGRGISLVVLSDPDTFSAMLDELEHLVEGTLFTDG
jgi:AcrR family transcriptional regulator